MEFQPDDNRFEKYRVEKLIGKGAYGQVYRVFHIPLNVKRAIKIISRDMPGVGSTVFDQTQERIKIEAQLGAGLHTPAPNPNLIQVYDYRDEGETTLLEMEYAVGGSLAERIAKNCKEGREMPLEEALRIVKEIAAGLAVLHERDYVHRDLKPSNILFDGEGRAKVADLGLVQISHGPDFLAQLSFPPPHPGTPAYMSPEQESTRKYLAPASDIYTLGLLLFEMLTGHVYRSVRPGTRLSDMRGDIPVWLDNLLQRMLDKFPEERPWDGAEMIRVLHALDGESKDEPACKECENCGGMYDARAERCPFCQLQEEERKKREEREPGEKPGEIEEELWYRIGLWLRNNYPALAIAAVAGLVIGLSYWFWRVSPPPSATPTPLPATETPELGNGSTIVSAIDGMKMVYVPAGVFQMGSDEGDEDEQPVHPVNLEAYWIDKYEVNNSQYEQCVKNGVCEASKYQDDGKYNEANQPVIGVSWHDAVTYCEWAGRRLPGEEEWEKAARGTDGREYPWGNEEPGVTLVNGSGNEDGYEYTAPVGSYPQGAGPYGTLDMAGNVLEWVSDWYGINYYEQVPDSVQSGPLGAEYRVLRGGSWNGKAANMRSADRLRSSPTTRVSFYGFRCALTAD